MNRLKLHSVLHGDGVFQQVPRTCAYKHVHVYNFGGVQASANQEVWAYIAVLKFCDTMVAFAVMRTQHCILLCLGSWVYGHCTNRLLHRLQMFAGETFPCVGGKIICSIDQGCLVFLVNLSRAGWLKSHDEYHSRKTCWTGHGKVMSLLGLQHKRRGQASTLCMLLHAACWHKTPLKKGTKKTEHSLMTSHWPDLFQQRRIPGQLAQQSPATVTNHFTSGMRGCTCFSVALMN